MGRDGPWLNLSGSACAAGGPFPAGTAALLAALMGLLVLATVLGNALVIVAFVVDRSLRTQGNFFFLNLAVADLLVGECWGAAGRGLRSARVTAELCPQAASASLSTSPTC